MAMTARAHKKQSVITNKGAADSKGIIIILVIIVILVLLIIFRNAISDFLGYLLSLIKNIFPA